ncbi:MAG: hypothetical protein J2P41_13075 [Blastocatellia bacterium]|nr:hypothetical protein [Blastocatellia bacterium]
MNPVVISSIIAAASFLLTIFYTIYLNQRHVEKLVEQLDRKFESRITGLEQIMNARFDSINIRFDSVERRLSRVEVRLDRIEQVPFKFIVPGA